MATQRLNANHLQHSGQNLTRILVASYFLAVGLYLIPGTTGTAFFSFFMPDAYAMFMASASMFTLGFLVLIGMWIRPAALLLGTLVFFSSFLNYLAAAEFENIGAFWRDMALIGALILTYTQTDRRTADKRAVVRWRHKVRSAMPGAKVRPKRVVSTRAANVEPVLTPTNALVLTKPAASILPEPAAQVLAETESLELPAEQPQLLPHEEPETVDNLQPGFKSQRIAIKKPNLIDRKIVPFPVAFARNNVSEPRDNIFLDSPAHSSVL